MRGSISCMHSPRARTHLLSSAVHIGSSFGYGTYILDKLVPLCRNRNVHVPFALLSGEMVKVSDKCFFSHEEKGKE